MDCHDLETTGSAIRPRAMSLGSVAEWVLWAALCYVAAGLAALAVQTGRRGRKDSDFSEIRIWLRCLLENGYDGETILFHDEGRRRFIRFEKYTDDDGVSGVELTFPEIGWGEALVPRLRDYAAKKGLAFRGSREGEPDYARVSLGDDMDEAFALCQVVWHSFYGFTPQARYLRRIGDSSDIGELMRVSAESQLSNAELQRRWNRHLNARLKHIGLRWLQSKSLAGSILTFGALILASAMGFLSALVGLPMSTLLALGDPPGWQLELGPVGLHGSNTSLMFLLVYVVSHGIFRRCMRFATIDRWKMTRIEEVLHAPKRAVVVAVPIAVLVVWLGI